MVERGRAVYDIFLSKGYTLNSKKLAKAINNANIKRIKKLGLKPKDKQLLKICQEIANIYKQSLNPSEYTSHSVISQTGIIRKKYFFPKESQKRHFEGHVLSENGSRIEIGVNIQRYI